MDIAVVLPINRSFDTAPTGSPSCSWCPREMVPSERIERDSVMRKLIALATLSTVAGLGAAAGLAGTASAAGGTGVITRSTTAFSGPTDQHRPDLPNSRQGDIVETVCWTKGQDGGRQPHLDRHSSRRERGVRHRASIRPAGRHRALLIWCAGVSTPGDPGASLRRPRRRDPRHRASRTTVGCGS